MFAARMTWLAGLAVPSIFIFLAATTPASADDVDIAVDAFAIAGASAGISIGDNEKLIVKAIVRCAASRKPVLTCARDEVVRHLPPDVQPLVSCMLQGRQLDVCASQAVLQHLPAETRGVAQCIAQGRQLTDCASAEAIRRLPPETQAIAGCLAGGKTFEACAGAEAARRMPPQTRDLASCIAQRTDIGTCAQHAAANSAHRHALDVIEKLKADGRSDLGQGPPTPIRNIINVAEGIREEDWAKVSLYGGAEVYKAAAKIVLNVLLTPAFQPLIGPIVDTVVQNRVDLFARLVRGLKRRDERAIGEVAVEAYLIMHVEIACSLPMPHEMREALCGTIGNMIKQAAHAGGDVAHLAEQLVTHPLNIPQTLWNATEGVRELAAGKKKGCEAAPRYYANRYFHCYHRGAYLRLANNATFDNFRGSIDNACRGYYEQCFFKDRVEGLCNPQRDMYLKHVNEIVSGLHSVAALYARSLPHVIAADGKRACDRNFAAEQIRGFIARCEAGLHKQIPLGGDPTHADCHGARSASTPSVHREACQKAIEQLHPEHLQAEACRGASAAR
jgi:hypothetical protein